MARWKGDVALQSHEHPPITVAIPTRNRPGQLTAAIDSILANDYPSFEVLVCDQSDENNRLDPNIVSNVDSRVRYFLSDERGEGRARNSLLRNARTEYVLYTDDDCIVPPDWMRTIESLLSHYPDVAVLFCNVEAAPHDAGAGFVPAYIRREDKLVTSMWSKCTARGMGAGMAVRKSVVERLGGFDSQIPACADGDIAVRALLSGHSVYETCATSVIHDGFRTFEQGRGLTNRNWRGIGQAYIKPLRAFHWSFLPVFLYELVIEATLRPACRSVLSLRPQGLRSPFLFMMGCVDGFRMSIDSLTLTYHDGN